MTEKSSDALPGDAEARDPMLVAIGQRLVDARLDYGRHLQPIRTVSQVEIGRTLGVTGVTVGAWEAGKNDAGVPMLGKLSEIYGVRLAWLITGELPMRAAERETYRPKLDEIAKVHDRPDRMPNQKNG